MNVKARCIPYRQTNSFSKMALDYIDHAAGLRGFYLHLPSAQGIGDAIEKRKNVRTNRELLAEHFTGQYAAGAISDAVRRNIELLRKETTFTITTAHQPNIFTGPLYFIYKILHTVKLADHCKKTYPDYDFVPVFYMGSEDADFDELGHCWIGGEKLEWDTRQTGAVGRMKVDKGLQRIIERIAGQVGVLPYGKDIIRLLKDSFKEGRTLQDATFSLLDRLFGELGLLVLIADAALLKRQMIPVFSDDLFHQQASVLVEKTAAELDKAGYKVQANPRAINLFYLEEGIRNRIEYKDGQFLVHDTSLRFSKEEIEKELTQHPERFSPNVILRGLYQETILPNIAFIGGGGEMAYWLQLKDLFTHYKVPYPVLVLRNSFLVIEDKWKQKIDKTGFGIEDYFKPRQELMNQLVTRESKNKLTLNGTLTETENVFEKIKVQAGKVDVSLASHTEALKVQAVKRLKELEKKMLRAEKRKFSDRQRQLTEIKQQLFPGNGLQERIDNFIPYYAKWGNDFIRVLLQNSLSLEQEFIILSFVEND